MNRTPETVGWLIAVEQRAEAAYREARAAFADDEPLAKLLGELADDEEGHWRLISELGKGSGLVVAIRDSQAIRAATEASLSAFEARLASGLIDRAELMEAIVSLEFSEYNELFIYMVNALRGFPVEFSDLVELLWAHRRRILEFLAGDEAFIPALALMRRMPDMTRGRQILIVEDEEAIVRLLRVFLAEEGPIDHARNGLEALSMLRQKDYALVVSDVDMPVMDGIEFFHRALSARDGIAERFLFITGSMKEDRLEFFRESGVKYIFKPMSMNEVKKAVSLIVDR